MSSSNNNNDDDDNGIGRAYSMDEEYPQRLSRNNVNPVEYLEFLATQEQYAPKNLSLHQESLPSSSQLQPAKEQFIQVKQTPSSSVHYVISPDDNPLLNNNNISNSNINNYNPYFPPTEQQMQQIQQFYHNKHTSNSIPLSPLDEVAHNPNQYQFDDTNTNRQIYQQSSQYQRNRESQQQLQQPQQLQLQQQPQQPQQMQQLQQFQRHQNNNNNINNNIDSDDDDDDDDDDDNQPQIDHSAVTPSPLSLPGLFLSRNRSRISTPRIENMPRIPNAYTAQVHQSDSPLRTEFRNSDLDGNDSDTSKNDNVKNMLGEILNKDRLSNFRERTVIKGSNSNESLVKFDFRNANGDPDDPLLNKNAQPREGQEEERPLPTGLLTGNINNSNNNIDNTLSIIQRQRHHSSIVSPTSITPIIQKPDDNEDKKHRKHDVIKIGPDMEIEIHKPKQGSILMLIVIFILAATTFITWKLGDWGVGNARDVYDVFTNNGFIKIYPSRT